MIACILNSNDLKMKGGGIACRDMKNWEQKLIEMNVVSLSQFVYLYSHREISRHDKRCGVRWAGCSDGVLYVGPCGRTFC